MGRHHKAHNRRMKGAVLWGVQQGQGGQVGELAGGDLIQSL